MLNMDFLAVKNVMRVIRELEDIRTNPPIPESLVWSRRIPSVSAHDGEIMARFAGRVVVADIINLDQKAVVRAAEPIRLTDTNIPVLKHGEMITSTQMEVLLRIAANNASTRDLDMFRNYMVNRIKSLRDGVLVRKETLLMGMLLDSFAYNRMGVQISGTWGMPSDLKPTVGTLWSNAAAATPVTNIKNLKRLAKVKYGITLNRVSMTDATWMLMINTTEFKNMAQFYASQTFPGGVFPIQDDTLMKALTSRIFDGMIFEFNDGQTWTENMDGTRSAANYHPDAKVILTATGADGNRDIWDWANGVMFETFPGAVPAMVGAFGGPQEGPIAYTTGADAQGNPPGWVLWAAQRGFPRRHHEASSAVLTVL